MKPLFTIHRNKLPLISIRKKRQLQHPKRIRVSLFTICKRQPKRIVAASPRAYNNFPDPVLRVQMPIGILWRESFIGMFMSGQHQVRVRSIQVAPNVPQLWMYGMRLKQSTAEERVMSIGDNA